jgi:hypothetical protein
MNAAIVTTTFSSIYSPRKYNKTQRAALLFPWSSSEHLPCRLRKRASRNQPWIANKTSLWLLFVIACTRCLASSSITPVTSIFSPTLLYVPTLRGGDSYFHNDASLPSNYTTPATLVKDTEPPTSSRWMGPLSHLYEMADEVKALASEESDDRLYTAPNRGGALVKPKPVRRFAFLAPLDTSKVAPLSSRLIVQGDTTESSATTRTSNSHVKRMSFEETKPVRSELASDARQLWWNNAWSMQTHMGMPSDDNMDSKEATTVNPTPLLEERHALPPEVFRTAPISRETDVLRFHDEAEEKQKSMERERDAWARQKEVEIQESLPLEQQSPLDEMNEEILDVLTDSTREVQVAESPYVSSGYVSSDCFDCSGMIMDPDTCVVLY